MLFVDLEQWSAACQAFCLGHFRNLDMIRIKRANETYLWFAETVPSLSPGDLADTTCWSVSVICFTPEEHSAV